MPLGGQPLVVRVARRVVQLGLCQRVVVATDSDEIAEAIQAAGFEACMTAASHRSGTERIAELAARSEFRDFDCVLNVQGDEPFVEAGALRGALARVAGGDPIGTAAGAIDAKTALDPNRVKVVVGPQGRAHYFSRAPIPYDRDGTGRTRYYQHIGVYAYTPDALARWMALPAVPEEEWERLEQLRPLLHGLAIGVALEPAAPARGIDTPEDLAWAEREIARLDADGRDAEGVNG